MSKGWLSVTLEADAGCAELLSEALMENGALTVSIDDADAGTEAETPQFGEPGSEPAQLWAHSRVSALFDHGLALEAALAAAAAQAGLSEVPHFTIEEVEEQDWVQLTQSQFDPIRIGERLWIVPSWHDAPRSDAINIRLDPGMAFGTGSHPTTRLCLQWLTTHVDDRCRVLDYGCGSGILAIAAALLGARSVVGVDIDDKAIEAARRNAIENQVAIALSQSDKPLSQQFDLVVANILTNPLCMLAPAISACVADGGRLALAGVLVGQAEQVIDAYRPFLSLEVGDSADGWVRLEGRRT